jgi:methyl-accepting chemotaxis protein
MHAMDDIQTVEADKEVEPANSQAKPDPPVDKPVHQEEPIVEPPKEKNESEHSETNSTSQPGTERETANKPTTPEIDAVTLGRIIQEMDAAMKHWRDYSLDLTEALRSVNSQLVGQHQDMRATAEQFGSSASEVRDAVAVFRSTLQNVDGATRTLAENMTILGQRTREAVENVEKINKTANRNI